MATTERESSTRNEKKGTSPSVSSFAHGQRRPAAGSTGKQTPNYLRPTISSLNEASRNIKNTGPEDTCQRPNLLRRRSFDRPASAARVHKELISPGGKKATAFRSASFSPKSSTAPKATLERVPKKPNAEKPQTLSSYRSMNKTACPATKKKSTSASKKPLSSHHKKEAQNLETKHENEETLDHQVEETVKYEQGEIDDFEIPKAEENEHQDVLNTTEVKSVEEGNNNPQHIPTVSQENNVTQTEEREDKVHEGKSDHTQHDEGKENDGKEEINVGHDHQERISQEEAKPETEDKAEAEDNVIDKVAAAKEIGEEKQLENGEENDEGSQQGLESIREEKVEREVEESKPEAKNMVAKSQVQAGHGKKESPTPYNDVIEETASKLREERKNKVRALVGAFETVIDKETSNAK